ELMRGDLVRILHAATGDVEYIYGDSISSLRQTDGGVHVTFEKGEPRTFDLVVGADGLHSNVRGLVFGDEAQFVRDLGHFISIFTVSNHRQLDRCEMMHATPGKTSGMYSTRQSADARAMFLFAAPPQLTWDRRDVMQQKKLIADTFAGEGWDVPKLLESMWDAPDFYFDSISQVRMDHWSNGRVALVGDAAYCPSPASGQGSSLGLVGAYVLAGELAAAAGDHQVAFTGYRNELRHFVEENQKLAESNLRGMVMRSAAQLRMQLFMLRVLPWLPGKNWIIGRVAHAIHKAASAITLKDYPGG
ncbi:MAG: FAD-dependent monooxygenase, partial [Myxococcaceae bacterium]